METSAGSSRFSTARYISYQHTTATACQAIASGENPENRRRIRDAYSTTGLDFGVDMTASKFPSLALNVLCLPAIQESPRLPHTRLRCENTLSPREIELIRDKKRRARVAYDISSPFLSARCQSKENKAYKGIVGVMKGN